MPASPTPVSPPGPPRGRRLAGLTLAALGVVYGDIGTSPLYAIRECFHGEYAVDPSQANVMGVLSLIFWALILVVSVKYLGLILMADHRGEGGVIALMALLHGARKSPRGRRAVLVAMGLFGAALLYGDGMITPAISVMSAVEGLAVATPVFARWVVPITLGILVGLFLFQHRGTGRIGLAFGPVTLVWFVAIGILGLGSLVERPEVLGALSPHHAIAFFVANRLHALFVLGAVFLVVTGAEALYADMGHFGRRPIRLAWFALVLPALLLNYFGQGARILADPAAAEHPFYSLVPAWAHYPMVALATAATVIASQAVISGAFSLTRQVVQLGFSPRVRINHTSPEQIGQIYIPPVNWTLLAGTVVLVVAFQSSSRLAAAYGVAVTTTMLLATILFYAVARERWKWSRWQAGAPALLFLAADLAFFSANIGKIAHGAWFPLVIGLGVFALFTTWRRGRGILGARFRRQAVSLSGFLASLKKDPPFRVPGTAVFMTSNPEIAPPAMLHNLRHNQVLHEQVLLVHVVTEEEPKVEPAERLDVRALQLGFTVVEVRYGYMEDPNIPRALRRAAKDGLEADLQAASYFLGRERLVVGRRSSMPRWQQHVFALLSRNALDATAFYRIPPSQVMELGVQVSF